MKTKLALSAVAAAFAVFSQGAFAQASAPASAAPKSRPRPRPQRPARPAGERPARRAGHGVGQDPRPAQGDRPRPTRRPANSRMPAKPERHEGREGDQDARKPPATSARRRPRPQQKAEQDPRRRGGRSRLPRARRRVIGVSPAKGGSSEPLFFGGRRGQAFAAADLADVAHRDLGRPLLVELEQLGRLEQVGERRVAVVARVERGLVADLLADRADARPAVSRPPPLRRRCAAARRSSGVAASSFGALGTPQRRRLGALVARRAEFAPRVACSTARGRRRAELVEVQEARARVDERLGRLLARRSRRPRRPWRAGASRAA